MRLTIACPESLRDDANALALVLGAGPEDVATYRSASYTDAHGNRYVCASLPVGPAFVGAATSALQRPAWDVEPYQVNMAGALRAQAALAVWLGGDDPIPQAAPDKLTAVAGGRGPAAIAAMGLTMIEVVL